VPKLVYRDARPRPTTVAPSAHYLVAEELLAGETEIERERARRESEEGARGAGGAGGGTFGPLVAEELLAVAAEHPRALALHRRAAAAARAGQPASLPLCLTYSSSASRHGFFFAKRGASCNVCCDAGCDAGQPAIMPWAAMARTVPRSGPRGKVWQRLAQSGWHGSAQVDVEWE
jgi:hypothetical protein